MTLHRLIVQTLDLDHFVLSLWRLVVLAWFQVYLGVKKYFFLVALYYQQPGEMLRLGPLEVPRCY